MYHYNLGMLWEEVAAQHGPRSALRYPKGDVTYARLHAMALGFADLLLERGCRQGDVIAIAHTKRPPSYALMLAALRLGIPYVNIDVESPLARTLKILRTSGALLLFYDDTACEAPMADLADLHGCPLCLLDNAARPAGPPRPVDDARLEIQRQRMRLVDGATIAYIMFTSGSTGVPKGVAVTHQNILHFIPWGRQCFEITPEDIFAHLSPMYFDNSVFDFYTGLFNGASLAPVTRERLNQPYELVAHVAQMRCSIWFSVPSLLIYLMVMKALRRENLPAIRTFSFGGEGYPKTELKKLYALFSEQARLVNVYGPTECTCICSAHELGDADFVDMEGLPTLGRLNQNFDYMILDEEGKEALSGELCLIGPNVSAGYFNDEERTAAAFVTLHEPKRYMKRMYRTGDRVRKEGGNLYFVGRKDNQIKHMGYRIELEEIENALIRLPQTTQAAVVYRRDNAAYGKIIAYVSAVEGTLDKDILKDLHALLPTYMLPAQILIMDKLPQNANGKVDRQALKAMVAV